MIQNIESLQCPNCHGNLAEYSNMIPIVVRCTNCEATHELSYVIGFWAGYLAGQLQHQNGDGTPCGLSVIVGYQAESRPKAATA